MAEPFVHFITNEITLEVISTILELAGPNFNAPYDSNAQLMDGTARNNEDLLQFQLPGGTSMKGYADPSQAKSIGNSINSLLAHLSPFMSAFGLILPILGVIRGIIEVLCALLNPIALIKALIKLFKKWIPPFISLFPPLAGVVIILSIIKAIIAIIFYVLTVIIPIIELIKANIKLLQDGFGPDGNEQQRNAAREKLISILLDLLNQLGVIGMLKPLLDLVFMILNLVSGFPCKKPKKKRADCPPVDLTSVSTSYNCAEEDQSCCSDDVCPPILKNPPKGSAMILPSFYADSPPSFAWNVMPLSGAQQLALLKPYTQSSKSQLDAQLDEPVDEAQYAGQTNDTAHFRLKITSKRGLVKERISPIVKFVGNNMIIIDTVLPAIRGVVNYEIVPNWEMLIKNGIVGLGCHPDVVAAKDAIATRFPDLEKSVIERHPEVAPVRDNFLKTVDDMNKQLNNLRDEVVGIVYNGPHELTIADIDTTSAKDPPYDDSIAKIDEIETNITKLLSDQVTDLKERINKVLSTATDRFNSGFDVDKNVAKSDGIDKAIITVIPRDVTGSPILKNMPDGIDVSVVLHTNFGNILNQTTNRKEGSITAEISSFMPGEASLTARINLEYVSILTDNVESIKVVKVIFVSDAILPKRTIYGKHKQESSEFEPGIN